jgi:hypothetical protein
MKSTWIKKFVDQKLNVAKNLYEGQCNGSYAEAMIILSSVISAISAAAWPGKKSDKGRFVELCVQYGDPRLEAQKISIPLLLVYLHKDGDSRSVSAIKERFPGAFRMFPGRDTSVVTGRDIDLFEDEIVKLISVDLKMLRKFSYASLFYEEVRCSFVHEYQPGEWSASVPMAAAGNYYITYANAETTKTPIVRNTTTNRFICFSFEWAEQLVLSVREYFEKNSPTLPFLRPPKLWLEA